MVSDIKFRKQKWFPLPHDNKLAVRASLENADHAALSVPIAMYDEGRGAPSSIKTNPINSSFAEYGGPNCFPGSTVDKMIIDLEYSLTKAALHTDNIDVCKIGFMPIFTSFLEDLTAIDHLTAEEIEDVLELQHETTDRQVYPLWSGTDASAKFAGSSALHADVPGLTAGQSIEGVAFDIDAYYDMLHYKTNAGKLKAVQGGIKWMTLSRRNPYKKLRIKARKKTQRMNEYTYFGVMAIIPQASTHYQLPAATDMDANPHVGVDIRARYNEWNEHFDFAEA